MSLRTYALHFGVAAVIVLRCLSAATQWAACMLAYQAALGPAWIDALGFKIYATWQLFAWWLRLRAPASSPPWVALPVAPSPSRSRPAGQPQARSYNLRLGPAGLRMYDRCSCWAMRRRGRA
jgi:hypothetical protein